MQSPAVVYVFRSFRPRRLMRCAHPPTNSVSTPRPPIGRTRAIVRGLRTRRIRQPFQPPAHGQIDRSIDRSIDRPMLPISGRRTRSRRRSRCRRCRSGCSWS
jgi:hypothetical protein